MRSARPRMAGSLSERDASPLRVSVVLATHNGGDFLAELLASIAEQTRPPAELVAYDDASSDDSVEKLERFSSAAPFAVRIIRGSSRVGSTRAFERALEACSGDLIALCDQDDLWRRAKVERMVKEFERDPELALVFSDATIIADDGRQLDRSLWQTLGTRVPARARDLGFFIDSLVRPMVPGCTAVLDAGCVEGALPFPPALANDGHGMQHDAWLMTIAGAIGSVGALPDALIDYRIHSHQQIGLRGAATRQTLRRTAGRAVLLTRNRALLKGELERRAASAQIVSARLEDVDGNPWTRTCHEATMDVAEHLQRRIALPRRRRQRVRPVLQEWRTRRYGRYSSGALSAVADAISST